MYRSAFSALFVFASLWATNAQAEPDVRALAGSYLASRVGTLSATMQPNFSDGQLSGCAIVFTALFQDWTYSKGAFAKLDGSFGLMSANSKIAVTLKVVLHDINAKTMKLTPSPPASAYLVSGAKTSKPFFFRKIESDTPGALFSIFQFDGAFDILANGILAESMTIAFNRRPGGTDITVPLDLTVEDTDVNGKPKRSHKIRETFLDCAKELSKQLN